MDFLEFTRLHERHPGLTDHLCGTFAEAARVCLSRHHVPSIELQIDVEEKLCSRRLAWTPPTAQEQRAHGNATDATEAGAYALSIAAMEQELHYYVIGRTDILTGADFYIDLDPTKDDLETAYRLEVSGVDHGDTLALRHRLRKKVQQTRHGVLDTPAYAAVVGFLAKQILIRGER